MTPPTVRLKLASFEFVPSDPQSNTLPTVSHWAQREHSGSVVECLTQVRALSVAMRFVLEQDTVIPA